MALICLVGFLAYSNTFDVPFQWDEHVFLKDNPVITDLRNFVDPERLRTRGICDTLKCRYMGYLTFALNYRLHGFDVRGYHVVNLAVHLANGLLVYLLLMGTMRTPFLRDAPLRRHSGGMALLAAMVFVAHPVQTEAVTYVFQRFASLAAFFYLTSLLAYVRWRLMTEDGGFLRPAPLAIYALSLASAAMAMKTKENAATLPLMVLLYEALFFGWGKACLRDKALRLLRLVPILSTALVIPLTLADIDRPVGEVVGSLGSAIAGSQSFTRAEYFLTQYRVFVTYSRLLLAPLDQNINYDYPVYNSFLHPEVFFSFLFFVAMAGTAAWLVRRSRRSMPSLRLIGFGILWFIATLSVESTVVVIPMLINEYRLYLPSVGVFFAGSAMVFSLFERLGRSRGPVYAALLAVPFTLASATYVRNDVWKCDVALWEDSVRKSPGAALGHNNLGLAYKAKGFHDKAKDSFVTALRLQPDYAAAHHNLAAVYKAKGQHEMAIKHYEMALRLKPDMAKTYNNLGALYYELGCVDEAMEHLLCALRLAPELPDVHNNIGLAYMAKGMDDCAESHFLAAKRLAPDYARACYNLGLLYLEKGCADDAICELEEALRIDPGYQRARELYDDILSNRSDIR